MKSISIRYWILLLPLFFGVASCELEENLQPEGNWDLSAPTILSPNSGEAIELEQDTPGETITFQWEPAVSSAGYRVSYEVVIDSAGTTDFSSPILIKESADNGEATSVSLSFEEIDQALAFAGYTANTESEIAFAVRAQSLSKTNESSSSLRVKRFENDRIPVTLFLSGRGAENNDDLSNAIKMKRLNDDNGSPSNIHEIYTELTAGEPFKFYSEQSLPALQYGGENGTLTNFGQALSVSDTGTYRVRVDLDNATYDFLPIDFWSMVGTPIQGGWGGDQPLMYEGNSLWKASIDLMATGGFAFRANGDWSYLLKQIVGSNNRIVMESDAAAQGVAVEDIPSNLIGRYFVTLDLSADAYTYSFEEDNTVVLPIPTPNELFLFENGTMIQEFVKNGDVFSSDNFIPMQSNATYALNSAMDGTGISYSVNGSLAQSVTPDGDSVSDVVTLLESNATFSPANDRALRLSIDFSAPQLTWTYYNFKLFHWQVWDTRVEHQMTYTHPNTYTLTTTLNAGYDSKFISPWDFDLGSDSPSALTGSLINGGGSNLVNIPTDANYRVTMVLNQDYQSGTYEFVQQ
ncbi:SusE domain-containing protein [Nonlabens xiamenensis]|uniref:SusE domain-containing protein n=1 Tax=Nonlabens xiamenensis TaxID=2341043 RepID=UPI000F60B1D3|nr:SusE domain-containing protein [Nonlabens xiamenensis]